MCAKKKNPTNNQKPVMFPALGILLCNVVALRELSYSGLPMMGAGGLVFLPK